MDDPMTAASDAIHLAGLPNPISGLYTADAGTLARAAVLAYLRAARERLAGISPRSVTLAKQNFHLLGGIDALIAEIGEPR